MVDSGAAVSACPPDHASNVPMQKSNCPELKSATGHRARNHGRKVVNYKTSGGDVAVKYEVASVTRPILA
eukprot:845921-Alexandrium_andersonii.AAC.1